MKPRGFTLVELLVTIAVVVIMATIAVPGFHNMMASNRLAGDYNELLAGLNYARSEAVKRRGDVTVTISSSDGIWKVVVDHDDVSGHLMEREARDGRVEVAPNVVVFNSLGRLKSCDQLTDGECVVAVEARNIVIGPAGRIERGN